MKSIGGAALIIAAAIFSPALFSPAAGYADPAVDAVSPAQDGPVSTACSTFGEALNLAAESYDEFAYATAGGGNAVDYADQQVRRTNVIGRTALREAAYAVLGASRTPGLPPEVSGSMREWSLHATKLLVIMGVRGGGDALNAAADQLNVDARAAQMACALHGGQP